MRPVVVISPVASAATPLPSSTSLCTDVPLPETDRTFTAV